LAPQRIVSPGHPTRLPEHAAKTGAFPGLRVVGPIFGRVRGCPMAAANDRRYETGPTDGGVAAARPTLVTSRGK
jgi:hypothetical protein